MVLKKKDFDIRGTWELTGFSQQVEKIVFFGTKQDGKYRVLGNGYGDYHVEEKNVSFGWATHSVFYFFVGFFTTPEYMEGTCKGGNSLVPNWEGTWSAKKISSKTEIE